ncbi:MAG TPA: hypothetical protein PLY23_09215 [Alphaproteobacteria bacterium]|nr:hypothetical protein [Alphaproteobacteria bacterium]HQS94786.1 hypothetical protein [Alphaproteobacteria bacterium]
MQVYAEALQRSYDDESEFVRVLALSLKEMKDLGGEAAEGYDHPSSFKSSEPTAKIKPITENPDELVSKKWQEQYLETDGFNQYIMRQSVLLYTEIKKDDATLSQPEARVRVENRLIEINTGPGVSEKIHQILNEIYS